ncbi:fibrous sheath-interacting protein 2 [Vulpes lagopus]|uniref:fibrous sheath-interacting protein 2 n=1 Tax=Vulpes lagopus TaxID=494514 RepID=UPI001BC9C760|nr:fibrous sheath-interacting protein 2 [Vulpes lagopus]
MELYLSACSKAASDAATKTASSSLAADSQRCGDGVHKAHIRGVGAGQLLDLPLGVKLPVIPGSNTLYYTTKISEKLFQPSYGFNLNDPYCRLLENQYKSLHDPHLREYYKRKDILRRLKKGGYITSNNKIVCTLRELNKYRQYLTSIKLDFERNYIRDQEMLAKQVNRLHENNQIPGRSDVAQFQNWLLQEGTQSMKDQEQLIRHRYLDMISRELEQLERTTEEQRLLRMDREERRQREYTRRKLSLRRKIEEEWKTKEMLLLTRIGEDVKREARIEEQRRRSREESDRKKQALIEKKMAYHLQKMQENGFKGEEMRNDTFHYRGQDGRYCEPYSLKKKKKIYDNMNLVYPVGDQKENKGVNGPTANVIYQCLSTSKTVNKKTANPAGLSDVQVNGTGQKKEKITRKSSNFDDRGNVHISAQNSVVSPQTSPTRNCPKSSPSYLDPPKDEKGITADCNRRLNKSSSYLCESGPPVHATAQGTFPSRVFSNIDQNLLENCLQEKVTSEELNSIIQNIMTWVVATVTSILYPAITKYEERLRNKAYPVSEDSILSSDSSSFCSTCSEEFTYGSYTSATTQTFHREPCAFAVDISVRRPTTPLKPPSAHVERTIVGKTYDVKGQSITSELKYNKTSMIYAYPKVRTCKSDSHLLTSSERCTKISKDATTETDGLESPPFPDQKAKATNEMKNLKNVFVNFKCHLKGETELILESIFQEIMSDLTQAIPSLSSVTAEVFVDQSEPEKEDLLSNIDICSAASEIVENMLEKLQSAVEKKCVEIFSPEDLSVDIKPGLPLSREYLSPSNAKSLKASLPSNLEPMCDIAEDMVHAILEKLMALASCKQNDLPRLEETTKLSEQQPMTDPTCTSLKRASKKKPSPEPDAATLIVKDQIQNLISNIFSQSSLVGYIEEAISTILGFVQTELNNERLIASEETIVVLQLLDDAFTQLHQEPVKADAQRCRHSRLQNPSDTEEKYRLAGTRLTNGPRSKRSFPPINVPGMVLYSEDDNEEIDKIVKNVLDSSFRDEKPKSQAQIPENQFTKGNTCFEYKKNSKPPTKAASGRSKVEFCERGLKTELPSFNDKEILKEKPCLNRDMLIFSQDEKHHIQKASENIVKSILTEMLKDLASVPGHLDSKTGQEASVLVSEKSQGLSHPERTDQMISVSEISAVAQEITDAVLNILQKASSCILNTTKGSISSSVQTSLGSSDTPHTVEGAPNKKPLKIWFDSEKKVKYLSSFNVDPAKPSPLKSEKSEPQPVGDVTDKIINTICRRLKLFICQKLQMGFKPSVVEQTSLKSQLSGYTTKVVNIVLRAIQKELELNKRSLNHRELDPAKSLTGKGLFADTDKLESLVSNLSDDIMESPLLTCIYEMLSSGHSDQSGISLPAEKPKPETSYGSDIIDKQDVLPSRQDRKSFHRFLATPCALHSVVNGKDPKDNARLQVLDSIGEALYEMLCTLIATHSQHQPPRSKPNREKNENSQMAATLKSNIQHISKTILEYILAKLCSVDTDTSFASPGFKAVSESLDIDNLSFASIIEEMAKCTDIISGIISRMIQEGPKQVTKSKAKTITPASSKTGSTKETPPNELKAIALDILNTVFAKLEGFANGNLETLGSLNDGNEESGKRDLEWESPSIFTDTHEELLQSALYTNAKRISSTILKAIQTELNVNSLDLKTSVNTPTPEKQMLKNIVNLILDAVSSDMFNETESEEGGTETYRYRPTCGNSLPGGAESDPFLEDASCTKKEFTGERTLVREEDKSDSLKQWVLERTLSKIEVKLKDPQKSPIVPIIRNILNEIFQNALVSQLNVLSLSHCHASSIAHDVDEPIPQTSVQFIDKMMGPIVSEADVIVVADDVVRTVFHKLFSATMLERNARENRSKTITFRANVSLHEHTHGGKSSVSVLDKNPCTLTSRLSDDKQAKVNIVEDIVQAILTNLETFATSKVRSLFCPQINFTVPMAFPTQDKSALSKALSAKDLYSGDQLSTCSVDHMTSEETNSVCQLPLNKLNTYATEVARKILQGIKHELDKERESPFLTHNIVVSESVASHIVNTVLDIVSSKGPCGKNDSEKESNSGQQEGIIEKLFNKAEYRKVLQFQIQDIIEGILCDIYEKTLYQNHLSYATATLKCSTAGKHSGANSETVTEEANKIIPRLSVPKSDVILISNDMVNIVLHNLSSAVLLGINAKNPTSARLPLNLCDIFSQAECQQPPLTGSTSERKTEYLPPSGSLKSAYADDCQITAVEKEDAKKSAPDPSGENANFITKTVFNRLEAFATERIDSLITVAFQANEESIASLELENYKRDDSACHESSQVESNVNVLKVSTKTILGLELTDSTFASYRENLRSTIHLPQGCLEEYADIITSAILRLIKSDLDLEIQKMYSYPNNISFQENIIVSGIVNSILENLYDKRSAKEISVYSKDNPKSFSPLTVPNEIWLGQREQEKDKLPQVSIYPLEQNQMTLEKESQGTVLEEIFMRNGESKQKEKTVLLSAVEDVLTQAHQRIIEIIGHLSPFNEMPHLVSNSKIRTSGITQKNLFQSQISSTANDMVESVFGKMYSIVVISLNKSNRQVGASDNNYTLSKKVACAKETKQTGKGSNATRYVIPQVYSYAGSQNVSLLENKCLQYSPSQVGRDLVQMVLNKIINFASIHLEETFSKVSFKGSPKPDFKTSLKARPKVTPLSKFRTKSHLGPGGTKVKGKTRLGAREKTPRDSQSKTSTKLPHSLSAGDAKNLLDMKLPTSELKMYAKDIISTILETIMKAFEKVKQTRTMTNVEALPSDQIMAANETVNMVLQELYATSNHDLAYPIKFSHVDHLKLSQGHFDAESLARPQACFYLENVSSQLEQIFPKEGIFKKMFDKWQAESKDMENEKHKLMTIAENVLTEIPMKAKELEYSLSLLSLPQLEDWESRCYSHFKGTSTRLEDTKAQINIFGREIVEMLFEKLQLCFLSQVSPPDSKETLASRKEYSRTRSKHDLPIKDILSSAPVYNTKTIDQISLGSSNQIVREIVERVLNILESFVDLQFKYISKYEFSEIVKMPIENFFPAQQSLLSKKMLPKLQPLKKFSDEPNSNTIASKENIQDTLLQLHSFHSELLTYAINIVSDMLSTIKNKLDKEISQVEPSSISTLKETVIASEIIGTLMDQCTHINNLPKERWYRGAENSCVANQVELATNMKMPTSKLKEVRFGDNPLQIIPGVVCHSEENMKRKYRASSNLPSYARASTEDTIKGSEPMERLDSENTVSCFTNKVQDYSPRDSNFGRFDQTVRGSSSPPEASVLQRLFKKANESAETALKQVMSFIEIGKGENPRVFHYETLKPVEPSQIQTNVSPLKICLAAENIVNTVLSSSGFPSQPHINETNMETMKPIFISNQNPLSVISEGQKNEEKSLLRTWDKKVSYLPEEEEEKRAEASWGDFSLLQKWESQRYPRRKSLKEVKVIAFADHDLGPKEIHLVARHITTSVVTYFKNFETRASSEEKVSIISTLSSKKRESEQLLRSIYNDSSLNQFCDHLTESVICRLTSSISGNIKDSRAKGKTLESQIASVNKIISVDSQMFESRSISIGELALSISNTITEILLKSNVIEVDTAQQMFPLETKYVCCPGVAPDDFDNLFQDLLTGVIHVMSKEIGINHHLESNGRKSFSMLRRNRVTVCNETNTMERQKGSKDGESSNYQIDPLLQKSKLNYLARKLDNLAGTLKTYESKEVVNKVFNIVLDLFLPDEHPDDVMNSGKTAGTFYSSSSDQQSNGTLENNLGLTPKSVFLLNVVCEKLIRTLLEKCTNTVPLDNSPLSNEISAEEYKLLKTLKNVDEEFDYSKGAMDCEQIQDYTSNFLENLAEIDQDLLSSESMLTIISHNLVKSLMEKLHHSVQLPPTPPFACTRREMQASFIKANRPELTELGQGKAFLGFMSYDGNALTDSLNNPTGVSSKIQAPLGKKCSVNSTFVSPLKRQGSDDTQTIPIHNKLYPGDINTGVYSAIFLEEIISELFFNLSTSLWGKNEITEGRLSEMNTLFVNNIVKEFNKAQVAVLRKVEERLCFPPIHEETISRIVDSVYCDVFQQYKLRVTCDDNLACGNTSLAEQITNGILLEILDYQLPSCFRGKLAPNSYYPLQAEIILQKLHNKLRKFTSSVSSSTGYSTMLSHSFLEDIIRRLLSQLIPLPNKASSLGNKYFMSADFNEMSTCIINKVISAISKHKILFTIYDNRYLCTGTNLQKMVDSVYSNIMQKSDSLVSIQKSIVSRSPIMINRIASFIIQEIIDNHLQPFLCGEGLPRRKIPLDAVSNMVKQVLNEVTESHRLQTPSPLGIYPDTFVGEIVSRLLSRIFSPKHNTEIELENMTQKIVNSINSHFNKAKIHFLYDDKEQPYTSINTDIVDQLVTSIYRNVLKQHGLDSEVDKESESSDIFVENITNLIVAAISDYLLHPLFSGDLPSSSHSIPMAENIVQDILSNISKSTKSSQSLSPYNTLLPYTFLDDMIRVLLSRIFPSASSSILDREAPKDRSRVNFNEIASKIISDIRMKISQHEIRFSKNEETKFVYSEDDVQNLIDSVFKNISQNSESQEPVEQNITGSNDILIDRIAGFIIKHICHQHLQPFVDGKLSPSSSYTYFDDERKQWFYATVYSSAFLEDVVSGVLSKIFHRVLGIVQTKSVRDSEDELFDKAEKLIHLIAEEFPKFEVSILENAEEQLCLPPVERDVVKNIIDTVYSKLLQEYEMEITPDGDFLNDTKTLATRMTKIILAETFNFQIHPNLIGKLPFTSHSKLNTNVLMKRVQCYITKSRFQRQASTVYTTMLSHTHLEKIVTQLISQMGPLATRTEHPDTSQTDLSNTVIKLINEIMSIISKHAICIIKHGNGKQSMISDKDIQSMVDSIYADLSYSNLYQSLTKDKKGISNIPVSKIASFIIKEIFNHHLQSFLSADKTLLSPAVDQTHKQKAIEPKQRELSFIVNSAFFLEEVISELLCKLLYAFSHNLLAAENPDTVKAKITGIVTTLVNSIVLEFTTSEILVADNFDADMCFSEGYREIVQKTVNLIYEKILDEYKSLIQVYRALQSDTVCFGRKIYHLLLEEIYDYQVQSLVSGELVSSSFSSPQADNIIRNVLNVITNDSHTLPSCITVLPRSLLEDMIYKLLVHIFPSSNSDSELQEEEVTSDCEFVDATSKLTEEIIKEISEHEVCLAAAEEHAESMQLEVIENLVDSICNNILKKSEFQAEVQKGADKKGGSFLSIMAGFIMKEIMDHHLQPFLRGEESSSRAMSDHGRMSVLSKAGKEKTQPALYSATFLEDVIVDLVHKFYSLPSITEDSKKKEVLEPDIVGLAIKFANSLIGEFRKSKIKVLPKAEEMFSFPPIDKETVDKISNFVYDQFIGKYGSSDIQTDDKSNIVIETIAALAQKAISAFKIQPLFSGDWSSTFFSFLNPDNITQRVQHLPPQTSTQINRSLKGNELALPKQSHKHTSVTTDQKSVSDTLGTDSGAITRKKSLKTEKTSMEKGDVQDTVVTSLARIMESSVINVLSMPAASAANKKKGTENKTEVPGNENASGVASLTTSVKSKARPEPDLMVTLESNEIEKTSISATKDEKRQDNKVHMQSPVAAMIVYEGENLGPNTEIKNEEKIDKISVDTLTKEDKPFQLSVTSKARNTRTKPEGGLKTVTQRPNNEDGKDPAYQKDVNEEQCSDYEYIQNVTENIYNNILELYHSAESAECSKPPSLVTDATSHVIQDVGQNFTQSVSTRDSSLSINKNLLVKEKEDKDQQRNKEREKESEREKWKKIEKVKSKEIKSEPSKSDSPHYPPKSKPGIVPAQFLEDVITEMVNKLIFSSSSETQICNRYQNGSDDENQAELYDTALKLMDSLLKEFSDAQIKVFRPHEENQFFPPADKASSVPKAPPRHKKPTAEETSSSIKKMTGDKMPHMPKMTEKPSSDKIPFLDKIQLIDKTLVNKVVHSSVCNILKEYKSQDSICKNIKSNGENLARRLTSAVINEIFQHQLNFILCDEVLASACLPLESKDVVRKVQKVAQTASKECQTSSPYTVMLPHKFLGNVISALLWKIFSTVSDAGVETSEYNWFTKLDFLQMKLLNTVTTAISKDKDMTIRYVESLHPNDDEIIQLVIHSIYNNLLSQFGSQEVIQNCVASRCRILSETIVDLVLQEVSGNQLQNYFSGELTPHQCTEVDKVVENILKDVIQTADAPQPPPSRVHILPYNIVEEITVKFLSKLLSMFPNVDEERTKSLETDMQRISSKILNSIQEFMSKSMIKLVPPAKELPTVPLANREDNSIIEKVVNSVYASVLKHSGSHTSVFKDLMGKSNVLSDVIGLLMVKEISNSEFQPPVEDKVSSSELVLEAVNIIEKVLKIVDEFKSGEKSSSKKPPMLDARLLEEALALFLAKIVRLQSISCKDAKTVSKPELNKIVSQLTKSVTAEISQSNINLVAADPEYLLNSESIEMISQVIDSVYSNVLQQSGTQEELYDDLKRTNTVFPKKVASLIINGVSHLPVDAVSGKNPNAKRFGNLDVNRIIQKAQKHAAIDKLHELREDESYQDSTENFPIRIVPHIGNKAINIDPEIISDHLAVISVKTEPLEKLKMECLRKTGHSITELRRASISGRSYSLPDTSKVEKIKRERRISLNRLGRLDVKPFEAVCRNSFQNIRKPDITKVELLKDVQNKKDLIIRLVAHDIYQEDSVNTIEEGLMSEDEVVLKEVTQEGSLEQFEDQVKEATKPVESTSSLKKFLSLSKCCQSTSSVNIECIEATSNHIIEPKARKVKRTIAELDMATCSRNMPETGSWEKKPQSKKEDKTLNNEPTHYFIHRIMSSSSYNQEDLISSASETEDFTTDSNDKLLEGNSQEQRPENSNSLKFITIFEGNKNIHGSGYSSKEVISETAKPSISKQGSKMLAKVSSALSKVFSRTNTNISKPSSSSHQDDHEGFYT